MKKNALSILALMLVFGLSAMPAHANGLKFEVTFTNITKGIVLTPPVFATLKRRSELSIFTVGEPSSDALQQVAEGGATGDLADLFDEYGALDIVQTETPVFPGESITVEIKGRLSSVLSLASMLLPTNDAFVALDGEKLFGPKGQTYYLKAYDAGSEMNDEVCANIPGPQCEGEGFNEGEGEGYVFPHAGIHGEAELSRMAYEFGNPVAKVDIKVKY